MWVPFFIEPPLLVKATRPRQRSKAQRSREREEEGEVKGEREVKRERERGQEREREVSQQHGEFVLVANAMCQHTWCK